MQSSQARSGAERGKLPVSVTRRYAFPSPTMGNTVVR